MVISKLNNQDEQIAKKIHQIQQAAYRIEANMMGFEGIPQLRETVPELQKSEELFIGYSEDQLQGVISYHVIEETVDIHRLVVDPVHFRKGTGKKLVSYLLKKYRGYQFIVSTGTANKPAIALYKMFGFQEAGVVQVAPEIDCTQFRLNN